MICALLLFAGLQFAAAIFPHAGHMQTADQVLQHCLAASDVPFSHLQSDAQRLALDSLQLNDMHFSHRADADTPLNAATILAVERACEQRSGSAKISSTNSFYLACSAAAAATLAASDDLSLSAQPAAAAHRMTNVEAAAVCAAATHAGTSTVHLIATIASHQTSGDIASAFASALQQVLGLHSIEVEQQSHSAVSFVCPAALGPRLSHWLLHRALVQQLQRRPQLQLMNANAAWIVQSNVRQKTSVWDQGLRGQGQVVHVGDTGVDWNLCFFQSPGASQSTPPPFFQQKSSSSSPLSCVTDPAFQPSATHKFSSYITIQGGDAKDEKGGHGTHVCGSAVGGAPNGTELFKHNGMAPAAQLAFTDVQGPDGGLAIPDDLQNRYFPCPYKSGARVSSNSWGGSFAGYSDFSASLDAFTVDNDDMLVVFAAGNDGFWQGSVPRPFSVGTPSVAKNALAVGASVNGPTNSDVGLQSGVKFSASARPDVAAAASLAQFAVNPSCFGEKTFTVTIPSDPLACSALCPDGQVPFANSLVLLRRGTCTFQSKASRAIACGAAAVVIISTDDQLITMAGDGVSPSVGDVPVFLIKKSDGDALSSQSVYSATYPYSVSQPGQLPMAFFSSVGPTYDGRIKPDIVAPGMVILSAKAMNADNCTRDPTHQTRCTSCTGNGFCHADPSVTTMMGTSMATPIVSGAAALVRQYFTDGAYPSSAVPNQPSSGFQPSGALLRAMLLASAHSVSTMSPDRDGNPMSLNNIPSMAQGHGIIQLDSLLVFKNSAPLQRLFVLDRKIISSTSDFHVYAFQATVADMAPQVTLSWTDPPMYSANVFQSVLVNDLNLELHSPSGRVTSGNSAQYVVNSVPYAVYDTDNNNERIVVHPTAAETGTWTVVVRANRLLRQQQQYALVFSAAVAFTKAPTPQSISCPVGRSGAVCSGNGQCLNGQCLCNDNSAGIACDMLIVTAPLGKLTQMDLTVNAMSWTFIRVPVVAGTFVMVKQTSIVVASGDADMFMLARKAGARLQLPTSAAAINQTSAPGRDCNACCDDKTGQSIECPAAQCSHNISFTVTDPSIVEYVLGVNAFCCDAAYLTLTVDTRFDESHPGLCPGEDGKNNNNNAPQEAKSDPGGLTPRTVTIIAGACQCFPLTLVQFGRVVTAFF